MYMAMAATCFIVAMALFIFHAGRFRRDGTLLWTVGWVFQGASWTLIGLRGLTWDLVSIVVANAFLTASFSLLYAAVRQFQDRAYNRETFFLPPAATFVFFWYFSAYADNISYRIIFISLLSLLQIIAIIRALFRGNPIKERRSCRLTGFAFLLMAVIYFIRLLEGVFPSYGHVSVLDPTAFRNASVIVGIGVVILSSIGFVLMIQERAEEALRKREESFRALAENSPDIIERFDKEVRHIYANPIATKLHGVSVEALIGKMNQEIGVPEHYCRFWEERIQKVFETGQAAEEENEFPTAGGIRIYQSRLVPEKGKDGTVTSVLMLSRDVTDRRRTEEILQEYKKVIESSQDMIAVVDRNYHYLIANNAFLKYRRVDREHVIGRPVSEVLGEDVFEEYIKKNLDTCLQGEAVQYEMKYKYPGLGERDLFVSYFPVEGPEGINRVACVIRDITEMRRMEEKLQESEIRRRLNAQILIAQENERRMIAHEIHDGFGSQLAAVKYEVESFLRDIDKNVIGRAGKSLESVIPVLQESLLEVRRIQMSLRPSILDDLGVLPTIDWFCREFEETYPNLRIEKEIMVEEKDISPSLKIVIYRTLQEAMNNITKHSKADLACLSLLKTEGKLELLVRDNGRGFDLRKVIGPENSRQGLGLISMRERTELSGGSFSVDSIEGEGTTIRAWWPLGRTI